MLCWALEFLATLVKSLASQLVLSERNPGEMQNFLKELIICLIETCGVLVIEYGRSKLKLIASSAELDSDSSGVQRQVPIKVGGVPLPDFRLRSLSTSLHLRYYLASTRYRKRTKKKDPCCSSKDYPSPTLWGPQGVEDVGQCQELPSSDGCFAIWKGRKREAPQSLHCQRDLHDSWRSIQTMDRRWDSQAKWQDHRRIKSRHCNGPWYLCSI